MNGLGDSPEDAELRDDEIVADGSVAVEEYTEQEEAVRFQVRLQNGEHDIAFAVQKVMQTLKSVLASIHCIHSFQLRRIIKHVRSSPQRRKKWEGQIRLNADELDAALAKAELILILDVKTRWSSTYMMLRKSDFQHGFSQLNTYRTSARIPSGRGHLCRHREGSLHYSCPV